ncbi:TIR-only protein-like [Impatiens glandulifera]|uniref:TIR-only protein-like n=1 Tax=Impatiens glandulifera TaxID=253017 RepID=UPI001FB08097|nr:TIR-only protein-like [Impatiens glandulifera]
MKLSQATAMQVRTSLAAVTSNCNSSIHIHRNFGVVAKPSDRAYDVFINHRGADTKGNISGLLYERLSKMIGLHTFLDKKSLYPGDKLLSEIDAAIRNCKVAVAVFSPKYCKSYYCLYELALIMESKKRLVPIFWNIQPSRLKVKNIKKYDPNELHRFRWALEEARSTVGLTFDSAKGYGGSRRRQQAATVFNRRGQSSITGVVDPSVGSEQRLRSERRQRLGGGKGSSTCGGVNGMRAALLRLRLKAGGRG